MLMVAVESPRPTVVPASSPGPWVASLVPHCEQNFAPSGFALPQLVQYAIADRLLSNPQGRAEVDGCSEPTRHDPGPGSLLTRRRARRRTSRNRARAQGRLVRRGVQQAVDRGRVGGHDLVEPAPAVRVAVDQFGGRVQGLVDRGHLAVDGRVEVADRLGRLQLTAGGTGGDRLADRRQGDVDDVAELVLGVVGDADPNGSVGLAGRADPLVLLGVLQVVGVHGSPCWTSEGSAVHVATRSAVSAGYPSRRPSITGGPVRAAGSLRLGELRRRSLAYGGDVERLLLVDLDGRAGVLELRDGAVDQAQRALQGVRVADHVEDVRRGEQRPVDPQPARRGLDRALCYQTHLTVDLHRLGPGRPELL